MFTMTQTLISCYIVIISSYIYVKLYKKKCLLDGCLTEPKVKGALRFVGIKHFIKALFSFRTHSLT